VNDLDDRTADRLADLLARSGAAVDVEPDVDAVLAGTGAAPLVALGRRPRDTRRLLALAAAVLVLVGLTGVALVAVRDDRPRERAEAPPPATTTAADPASAPAERFPVFGHLPGAFGDAVIEANAGEGSHRSVATSGFAPDTPLVRAALGRVADDGTVSDVVLLTAGAEAMEEGLAPGAMGAPEDLGGGYRMAVLPEDTGVELYGPGTTVLLVGGPGTADLVRGLAGTGLTATVGDDGGVVLDVGDLPDGLEVVVPPARAAVAVAETYVDSAASELFALAETGVGPPLLAAALAGGTTRPVDVDGAPGYVTVSEGRTLVAWTAADGVDVAITVAADEEDALAVAAGIELVDEATWRATYPDVEPPAAPEGAALPDAPFTGGAPEVDHPLVGRPLPAIPDVDPEELAGTVVVARFGPTDRSCCLRLDAALVDPDQPDWEPEAVHGEPDDPPVADREGCMLLAVEVDLADLEAWSLTALPTTVVAGPDGIVEAVFVGATTAAALDAAVEAAIA
jgi:hypothetical protein